MSRNGRTTKALAVTVGNDVAKVLQALVDGKELLEASRLSEKELRVKYARELGLGGERELHAVLTAWKLCDLDLEVFGSGKACPHGFTDWDECPVCGH